VAWGLVVREFEMHRRGEMSPAAVQDGFFARVKSVLGELFETGGGS